MDQKQVQEITKLVITIMKNERRKEFADERTWRYKNTKLLLVNYDILKKHTRELDYDIDAYLKDVFSEEDRKLRSITGYKVRTKKMIEYTDLMFKAYGEYALKRDEQCIRRYKMLKKAYFESGQWSAEKLGEFFNVSAITARRDLKDAIHEFSIFLFGIVSLEEMVSLK